MKRYKVLHIITRFDKGGSAENTLLTVIGLDKERYNVTMAHGPSTESLMSESEARANRRGQERAKSAGIKLILIPELIRCISPVKDLKAFLKIFLLIKREKYTIIHTHTSKAGILGRWAALFAGVPIIIHTPHGHAFIGYFGRLAAYIFILTERITAIFTDTIITLTDKCKKEHVEFKIAPPERFRTIHSGVEMERFLNLNIDAEKKRRSLGITDGYLVVGTIGRLAPIKGHKYLIDAIKTVSDKIANVRFLFVGEGPLRLKLIKQAEFLGVIDKILFLGWREDIPEILSVIDLFVLTSLYEGMGKVFIETMVMEKPVVATRVGGIPDIVRDGEDGILIPAKESIRLADAIITLLEDKDKRKKMGRSGKGRASLYSDKDMVAKIDRLYNEWIQEKDGR
ncbi:MAG: glycosyltransferase family 4 protein [Nitrospinota bacterium]